MGSILVLGGAGYIGSHTVYELIDAGESVVIVDNLLTGFKEAVHPKAKFYEGDIRDRAFMDSVFEKEDIDGVIHFAASSQVGESMKNPLKYYSNNLCGTEVLLESMVTHGIDKIVFSSTAATYGEPESIPILETDRTLPTNCYGETKLSMEKMFKWTSKAHNLRFVSLRYFNACGAHPNGQIGEAHNPETHLIPLILQVPNNQREYISVFGNDYDTKDGTCVRDYIHVNDLAQAHILAMKYLRNGGESDIFNLGNGVGFTVKEVVDTARKVTGHPIPAKEEERRAGDPSTLIASSDKAKTILGWNPQFADLEIVEAADHILGAWRGYTDESAFIFSETDGTPHNTITPIARMHEDLYELDLVLRNNITTDECPWGVYHPTADLHHIKKENIGLIEVMGLAVLPARLKKEMAILEEYILEGKDIRSNEDIEKHADWVEEWMGNYSFNKDNIHDIIQDEISKVFVKVLECAGVYKRTEDGMEAFMRFVNSL